MPGPTRDPLKVAKAWELHAQGHSLRFIAESIGVGSPSTAAAYVEAGRAAELHLELYEVAKARQRMASFLELLGARGVQRLDEPDAVYEDVAPVLLKVADQTAKLLGLNAPTSSRVQVQNDSGADLDPEVIAEIAAARERAAAQRRQEIES